jgi:hypothetical protein
VNRSPYVFEGAKSVSVSTEVRWFIPGQGPQLSNRGRSVVDSYSGELIAGGLSAKVRDGDSSAAFVKIRIAVHPATVFGEVEGVPETWLRIQPERISWNPDGDRFEVRKQIVRHKGIEVAHLEFGDEFWWSLAIRTRDFTFPRLPRKIVSHLRRHHAELVSCSYPTWLLSGRTPSPAASCSVSRPGATQPTRADLGQ